MPSSRRSAGVLVFALVAPVGCSGPIRTGTAADAKVGEDPLSHVEMVISSLTKADAEAFKAKLEGTGRVENVVLKSYANSIGVYEADVRGCECDLPAKMESITTPGFKYLGRLSQLRYAAFDNISPTVSFVFPVEGKVVTEPNQFAVVEVPDQDIAEVTINGVVAQKFKGNLYRAQLNMKDGVNDIVAIAKDHAGNTTKAQVRAAVDTTPPALEATVKIVVEGTVDPGSTLLIDGKEVPTDSTGHYHAEVSIRKGQRQIELVAVNKNGLKTTTLREIGN